MSDFNKTIIDEFHANGGTVTTAGFGRHLILVHTIGAKSGTERINPLMSLPDGAGGRLIIGSFAGSTKDPAWVHNLRANPDITMEVPDTTSGITTHPATAAELDPVQREQAWLMFVAASEQFLKYTETADGRKFPIFRLTPTA